MKKTVKFSVYSASIDGLEFPLRRLRFYAPMHTSAEGWAVHGGTPGHEATVLALNGVLPNLEEVIFAVVKALNSPTPPYTDS
jgi:hypothetical protein